MNNAALNLGIIKIYGYSIFILLGIIVATTVIYKEIKKFKIDKNTFFDFGFNTVIISLIGARIYYVLFNLSYYSKNLIEILEVWNGGLAIHGAIIAGGIYIIYYCKKNNYNILKLMDIIVTGLIIGQAIGRWGNFFNQEAYGAVTTLAQLKKQHLPKFIIDGMNILGEYHEPMFLYESIWNLIGFLILIILRRFKSIKTGQLTGTYLVWYSLGRFVIEKHRTDSLMFLNLKMAQIVSLILLIVGLILIISRAIKNNDLYHKEGIKNEI